MQGITSDILIIGPKPAGLTAARENTALEQVV